MMLIDYYESSRDGLRAEGRISTPKGKDNG
jgi:hypothetical protein